MTNASIITGDNKSRVQKLNWRPLITLITHAAAEPVTASTAGDDSTYERFAIPYKFQPRLRLADAAIFAMRALLRIFLGSILFGAWGAYTLLAWVSIHNPFLRAAAIVPLFALFLVLMTVMMVVTAAMHRSRRT